MDELTFAQLIRKVSPVGVVFQNLGGGTSTIISHSDTGVYYRRGSSSIRFRYTDQFDALRRFRNKMVTSADLREYKPAVFDSKRSGHSCNCSFLFILFKSAGLVDSIKGTGVRGDPFRAVLHYERVTPRPETGDDHHGGENQ
jgi:hypothetical protein